MIGGLIGLTLKLTYSLNESQLMFVSMAVKIMQSKVSSYLFILLLILVNLQGALEGCRTSHQTRRRRKVSMQDLPKTI